MKMKISLAAVFLIFFQLGAIAQSEDAGLIAPNAELIKVRGDFGFIEGPVADESGNLFFTDIANSRIHKLDLDGRLSIVREPTNRANGLIFDTHGNLIACEGGGKRVTSMSPDGSLRVLADEYDGRKLNSPNDLWMDDKGGIYFTDPNYGAADNLTQEGEHVYYLSPDRETLTRVVSNMGKPNGIIATADNQQLYVADTELGKIFVFDIKPDGTLGPRKEFVDSGSDGVTLDERGNLYITWTGGVGVYSPQGEQLDFIETPEMPTNVGFAGKDHQTLYITARTGLYAVSMAVKGLR